MKILIQHLLVLSVIAMGHRLILTLRHHLLLTTNIMLHNLMLPEVPMLHQLMMVMGSLKLVLLMVIPMSLRYLTHMQHQAQRLQQESIEYERNKITAKV